jgi:hypothetical protein
VLGSVVALVFTELYLHDHRQVNSEQISIIGRAEEMSLMYISWISHITILVYLMSVLIYYNIRKKILIYVKTS